jgi:hypothetical protein
MGRPAWATDDQWTWLKGQATEYLKIKGKKNETIKFWPAFLDAWKEQWPNPALNDLVRDEGSGTSTDSSTTDANDGRGTNETITVEVNAGGKQQSASTKTGKKSKKPLTVSVVRICSSTLGKDYTDFVTEIETMDE